MAAFDWAVASLGMAVFPGTLEYAIFVQNIPVGVFGFLGAMTAFRQQRGYADAGYWTKNQ